LSDKQVETALKLQNAVIKRFRRADSNHPLWETFKKSQWLKDTYLLRYEQQTQMPTYLENFWFHYLEEEDVVNWSKYLQTVIPTIEAHYQSQISISK
jgi:regulator of PEP synthase PpsR (kinase-PPPase family)